MKKIVILGVNTGIGNVIMGEPLARKIKLNKPHSEVIFIVSNNSCKAVLENNPSIDKVVIIPRGSSRLEDFFPFKGFKLLRRLKKEKISESYTIIPHSIYQNVCSRIISAKKRIAPHEGLFNFLNTEIIEIKKQHDVLNNMRLCKGRNPPSKPKIFISKKRKKEKRLVGIHLGCDKNSPFKRWPIENFLEFAEKIRDKEYNPVFFLGPDEKESAKEINKKKFNYSMEAMEETIQKISKCSYFVSNDSGLSHIAEGLEIPLLTIIGPSDYRRTGSLSKNSRIVTPENYKPWSYTLEGINNKKNGKKIGKNSTEEITVKEVEEKFAELVKKTK